MDTYDNALVRKKRKKIAAIIVSLISLVAIIIVTIIAFLGTNLGNYTIKVGDRNGAISLSDKTDFATSTTFLTAEALDDMWLTAADRLPDDDLIDANNAGSHNQSHINSDGTTVDDTFVAYTFYVQNVSSSALILNATLKLVDVIKPTNVAVDIIEYIRIRLYTNLYIEDAVQTHNSETFAKRTNLSITGDDGKIIDGECISKHSSDNKSCNLNTNYINNARATTFYNDEIVFSSEYSDFSPKEKIRYTVVMWLEGYDYDTENSEPPQGSSCKFEMVINAVA